jgi:hypothetical protein
MNKVNFFLLCENFIADDKGRISLINVFDAVNSSTKVATPSKFVIAIGMRLSKQDLQVRKINMQASLLDPNSKTVFKGEGSGEIPEDKMGATVVSPLDLSGKLQFKVSGKYTARLFVNNKKYAETYFNVNLNQKSESGNEE